MLPASLRRVLELAGVRGGIARRFAGLLAIFAMVAANLALTTAPVAAAEPSAPSIQSDQADYPPGALVHLSGANWQPGEPVHIYVNDDQGKTWARDVDVLADADGVVTDSFNLPDWFVATYQIRATGELSGVATSSFTDGNFKLNVSPDDTVAALTATAFTTTNCSGPAGKSQERHGRHRQHGVGADRRAGHGNARQPLVLGLGHFGSHPFTTIAGTNGLSICAVGFNGVARHHGQLRGGAAASTTAPP